MFRLLYCTEYGFNCFMNISSVSHSILLMPFVLNYDSLNKGNIVAINIERMSSVTGISSSAINDDLDKFIEQSILSECLGSSVDDIKRLLNGIKMIDYNCFNGNKIIALKGMLL